VTWPADAGRPEKRSSAPEQARSRFFLCTPGCFGLTVSMHSMWQAAGRLSGFLSICAALILLPISARAQAVGIHGAIATVHPRASEAGLKAMQAGGNAIDAVIAAALTLGVVDGFNSGIGGGCFILIRLANGSVIAIDGRETAPGAAKKEMFVRNGTADPELSRAGPLSVGVPGALAAYQLAATRYGRLGMKPALLSAADLAEQGFAIDAHYAAKIQEAAADLKKFPGKTIFLHEDGSPKKTGEILKQPDLALTYRNIANGGVDWFYKGAFAASTEEWMRLNGGLLTADDFRKYRARTRDPMFSSYRGFLIVGFPPPSSGGIHVAEILNVLENFNLTRFGPNSADTVHVIAEAMKLAFADRAKWLGDPDFVRVPRSLISKPYGLQLSKRIRLDRATAVPGAAAASVQAVPGRHTTHISAADAIGNWVACTTTINTTFGSKVVVPGTGVVLNNEMDDFSAQPGATNYFGLVGSEANSIAPGKRPLSSMSPTIVIENGIPTMAFGAAGGPTIISQAVLALVRRVDFNLPLNVNLAQPRFHHQWRPDELKVESSLDPTVISLLQARGHRVVPVESIGVSEAVGLSPDARSFWAVSDPRTPGQALAY